MINNIICLLFNVRQIKKTFVIVLLGTALLHAIVLPGFSEDKNAHEQTRTFVWGEDVDVHINAPGKDLLDPDKETIIVFYALPAGNTIEWTIGKKMQADDDWHFDIQHIGAQTRFLRNILKDKNLIVIYIQPNYKGWQLYDDKHPDDFLPLIQQMTTDLLTPFKQFNYKVTLSGHSAGGSWVLRYLQGVKKIPKWVDRIVFIDSNYNYKYDAAHYDSLFVDFLMQRDDTRLCVMAYNDSVALYKGKSVVSAEGGTWWNTRYMLKRIKKQFHFIENSDNDMKRYNALSGRFQILLKENQTRAILHTLQVYKNGFIHSMLSGTKYEHAGYRYYGQPAYLDFIK